MKKVLLLSLTFICISIFFGILLVAQETENTRTGDPEKNDINSFQLVPGITNSIDLIDPGPQYFNYNTNSSNNSFPFNIANGKDVQLLYLPGDFNQPTPAPAGNITSISFRIADSYPLGPWTYTYFTIKMGQSTITSFTTGAFYTPLTTVYYRASVSLTGVPGQWMTIPLDNPFPYDPAKSLIVDLGHCGASGASGFSMCYTNATGNRRIWSVGGCPFVYSSLNSAVYHMGLTITPNQSTLIAHYPLLSDGIDLTGNNNPMTLINAPFQNGGVYCNGIYDINYPQTGCKVMTPQNLTGFNPNSFEISMDFMLTANSNQFSSATPIFIGGDSYRWVGFCQYYEGGSHKFSLLTNNSDYTNTQTVLNINQWNNAKISYNGTTVQAFLNGQLIYAKNVALVMGNDYNIGATNYSNGTVFKGYLKELKVISQKTTKTLGNTTVYTSVSTQNNRRAMPVTFTEAGTIQSISIYHNGGSGGIMLGVYSDASSAPSSRLGVTASTTVSSTAGWQTVSLTSPVTVSSGQRVWLAWVFQNNPGIMYTTGTPARAESTATWAGGMPTTFGTASYANYKYSVFCTYTPGPATKYLNVSPTSITLGSASGLTGNFNITSNTTWSVTDDASWLSVSPVSGSNNGTITVTATSANTGTTARTATVTVAGAGVAYKTVTVTQAGSTDTKTLGNTTVYGLTSTTANRRAQIITFPEPGTIQSISIYHNGGTGRVLLAVYDDVSGSPGGRLGMTPETVINASAGWQTVPLTSPVVVTAGQKVWLSWVFENNPGVRYIAGTPARAQSAANWSGGLPNPFGAATFADYKYSAYCSYVAGGPGPVTKTLGNTTVYGLTSTTANRRAQTVTFPEAGTMQSITIYHNGGTGSVLLGVYADAGGAPGARLGVTPSTVINASAGWQTISLTSPVTVTSGQMVWLSWVFENNPGIRYIAGTPARAESPQVWAGGMPDPFGTSSFGNYKYSLYCTYTTGTGPVTKTLGNTEVYSLSSTTANRRAQTVTFPEAGTIESISIYHNGGTGQVILGVYADASGSPGARLGVTAATVINATAGWQTIPLTSTYSVASGQKLWLSWVFQTNPGIRYVAGTPARAESPNLWAGGMPDPFGTATFADYKYSLYCTYSTGSGDEIKDMDDVKSVNTPVDINSVLMDKEEVLIYPNPTEGNLTVTWKNRYSHRLVITIYNILGKAVKEVQTDPDVNEIRLDLNGTSRGIYLFEMKDRKNDLILNRSRIIKK